jgi:GDPmannose 4,6-dehydratase
VAKLAAHEAVSLYRNAYGVYACAGILFNHESERRGENFVTRKITQYVAMLLNCYDKTGQVPVKGVDVQPLYLGNLDARRDWSHAEDMVRGMWMMLQQDEPNDYVLGSGKARSVRDFLVAAFDRFGHSWEDYVEIDPKFYRPAEVHLLEANPTKAQTELGWEPKVSFQDLVNRMVDVDYEAIKKCRV